MGFTIKDKHLIKRLLVRSSNEYLILTSIERLITPKHTLKILCKYKHFSQRYKRKREWVFFSEHSVALPKRTRLCRDDTTDSSLTDVTGIIRTPHRGRLLQPQQQQPQLLTCWSGLIVSSFLAGQQLTSAHFAELVLAGISRRFQLRPATPRQRPVLILRRVADPRFSEPRRRRTSFTVARTRRRS